MNKIGNTSRTEAWAYCRFCGKVRTVADCKESPAGARCGGRRMGAGTCKAPVSEYVTRQTGDAREDQDGDEAAVEVENPPEN